MKHRDRVITALNHESPDRCPMQISFTPEFAARLRKNMDLSGRKEHNPHGGGNTYELERALDQDMLLTSVGWANSYYRGTESYTDEWGVTFRIAEYETKFGKGKYTEMLGFPLDDDKAVDSYNPPDPLRPELYEDAEATINNYKDEYWIVGVTVTTVFETAWALRGLSRLLMDFIENPELAGRILDIPYRYHLAAAKKLVKMGVDMIWTGDDMGTQTGMIISPDTWRHFFKPRMANFFSALREINPEIKIAYHSDGSIEPIIPDLIEIGLDLLNPVQPRCMDPAKIKARYGKNLCFWGSIDEQYTLPFGTPEQVKNEVITRLKTLGENGGLIIGPTHHVQLDTPLENFRAMHETIQNTGYSSLKD
ncbi:MAG TPA: uroporphyrinogen decarboxylase family protein [archaeon]|nr:uroporphyrinogen decarboxylase family protein [archaeon]